MKKNYNFEISSLTPEHKTIQCKQIFDNEIQNFDNELNKNAYIFNQKGQVIIVRGISE